MKGDYFWCQVNRNELHYPITIEKIVNRRQLILTKNKIKHKFCKQINEKYVDMIVSAANLAITLNMANVRLFLYMIFVYEQFNISWVYHGNAYIVCQLGMQFFGQALIILYALTLY